MATFATLGGLLWSVYASVHAQKGLSFVGPASVGLLCVATMAVLGTITRRGMRLNQEGQLLLERGEAYAALGKFKQAVAASPDLTPPRANIAIASLHLWKLTQANAQFAELRRSTSDFRRMGIGALAFIAAALANRQAELASTRAWLQSETTKHHPAAMLAEAFGLARENDFAGALRLLDDPAMQQLGSLYRQYHAALSSWCAHMTGQAPRFVDKVSLFGPADPGEFEEFWPEFARFVLSGSPNSVAE